MGWGRVQEKVVVRGGREVQSSHCGNACCSGGATWGWAVVWTRGSLRRFVEWGKR